MLVKIIGINNQKFEIKNEEYKGQRLYYTYENEKTEGLATGNIFARNGEYKIDDEIELAYSQKYQKLYIKK